ncbi:developmental regulator flbA [Purpureocillium lavendulum]|uniref:Developmental regulator flbA n=1 Tax=Purpureocillium lavendulum TaxID=1247861 RepID=A0AB34G7W0_9HYPO|nr:developmental regulator flbA [Purpureocillium lavendulum]
MSIFSGIRKSRQQAKEHNAKLAEQKKLEQEKVPYKHVPTHAATDAFASAPPSWREADRPRIIEQNRRRSAMAASGHHMNMPGVPRVGSSLSHVSYPGEDAAPTVRLPRAYSYNGVSPYVLQGRDVVYSVHDASFSQPQLKGKEISRGAGYEQQRVSPTPSKGLSASTLIGDRVTDFWFSGDDPSPVESSAGSTSSQDDLEMRPTRPAATRTQEAAAHRLHPAHKRRTSDASVDRLAMANSAKAIGASHYGRDSRPPPSMRGFASINQVAAPVTMHLGALPTSFTQAAPSNLQVPAAGSSASSTNQTSRQSSTTSLPGLTPTSSRPAFSAPTTPAVTTANQSEYYLNWSQSAEQDIARVAEPIGEAAPAIQARSKDRRPARATRFSELERIDSMGSETMQRAAPASIPPPVAHEDIINVFPEPASMPEPVAPSSNKSKRLSKGGGKLLKKSRWYSSKPSAVAV